MRHATMAVLLLGSAAAWAGREGPKELLFGELRVSDLPGQDVIRLPKCEGTWNEPVARLIIEVRGGDLYLHDLALRDEAGETRTLPMRATLKARQQPHFVDVGEPICVTYVELIPDPAFPKRPMRNQPVLTVRGEVATPEPIAEPPPS